MANIKFSQFTVGNTESDIDFVVGYKGANNIQISPTNLLAASLSGYLPLTGGTMTGDIIFNDGIKAKFGSSSDLNIYHTGTGSVIQNAVGNLTIQQDHNNGDIIFRCDDGSGGTAEYLIIDGSAEQTRFFKDTRHTNNVKANFGNSDDLQIYHNSADSLIDNNTGHLYITNYADNKNIYFRTDNGSGGTQQYFYLDGSLADGTNVFTKFVDNSWITMGNGGDLLIGHQATSSKIENYTGPLYIVNKADDQDIIFQSDDGSGGIATYFYLDGSNPTVVFSKSSIHTDNIGAYFGTGLDLQIYHNGSNDRGYIYNATGDLYIENDATDGDIKFFSDDGSGGTTEYFRLDGGDTITRVARNFRANDNVALQVGVDGDAGMYHDGTNTYIQNDTGDLYIRNNFQDRDIIFQSDDGNGGIATYFQIDGSVASGGSVFTRFPDNSNLGFGNSDDLTILHDSNHSYIKNYTGDLYIENFGDDKDIIFKSDDGSGGVAEYFRVDGSGVTITVSAGNGMVFFDNIKAKFGNSDDMEIYHDGSHSYIHQKQTGDLYIQQSVDDGDIVFQSDDGSGGMATYFRIDGSDVISKAHKNIRFLDNIKGTFGNNDDLQIYHDGSNSYITDTGTGFLNISSDAALVLENASGETYFIATSNGSTKLYYDNSSKLETRSTGIKISGVSEYADNTAAIAGGLTTGDVYRTGDLLKIVH